MKVLSLDQASAVTGYALFDDGNLKRHGVLKDKVKQINADLRLHKMSEMISDLVDDVIPDVIVMEDTQQQQGNIAVVKLLCRLQGIIMGICYGRKIHYKVLAPAAWRKELGFEQGKGIKRNELKQQSINYVANNYNIMATDDESDAICIGLAYIKKYFTKE